MTNLKVIHIKPLTIQYLNVVRVNLYVASIVRKWDEIAMMLVRNISANNLRSYFKGGREILHYSITVITQLCCIQDLIFLITVHLE
jgi:hypothetical protein